VSSRLEPVKADLPEEPAEGPARPASAAARFPAILGAKSPSGASFPVLL
jgi:hypothetical protein